MILSNEIIDSYICCKYKAFLIINGNRGNKSDYDLVENRLCKIYRDNFFEHIKKSYHEGQILTSIQNTKAQSDSTIIINPEAKGNDFSVNFDAIEISSTRTGRKRKTYIPIIISPKEAVTKNEKVLLTVKTLLLNRVSSHLTEIGRIIYGKDSKTCCIKIKDYRRTSQRMLDELEILMRDNDKPLVYKNGNCQICEFEKNCRKHLIEKDDLSLLGSFSLKEIIKRNKKGVFTINQLSYNFRPKKFRKTRERGRPFSYELKALAIRDKKTYVLNSPIESKSSKDDIYIDFEGLPDEKFVYLIGIVIKSNGSEEVYYSFWADSKKHEKIIFQNLLKTISRYDDYAIYHYGSYEAKELKRVSRDYPELENLITSKILQNSVNLLSHFYSNIYTPTFTNGLKDIGSFLGFKWSADNSSGIQSIAWRKNWEVSNEDEYKEILLKYNSEDCNALIIVKEWIDKLRAGKTSAINNAVGRVDEIKHQSSYKFGKTEFLIPDFEAINNCGYFNYQREKVFIKTNLKIKKIIRKQNLLNKPKKAIRPNVYINLPTPKQCLNCGNKKLYRHKKRKRLIEDLKFMKNGVKRCVIEYEMGEFRCSKCFKLTAGRKIVQPIRKNLYFWVINQYIVYGISFDKIGLMLSELFSIAMSRQALHRHKALFAVQYEETYEEILRDIVRGPLLHIDETKIKVGKIAGYVWVLTNIESVYYLYKPSREADFLKELLKDFKGVLISDFYSAYDSIECPQQKCLIHLIRDLNDDLVNNQFNYEFKEIVMQFGKLLREIMGTIDRYGLKRRYFNKHKKMVKHFFDHLQNYEYKSELAIQYQKKFKKNRDKLFTFLDYDSIPWNNNNAEHAIKHLARYRRNVDGLFSKKGVKEYLILLSIYQTCKYKGLNFLKFLMSEEKSIFSHFEKYYRIRKSSHWKKCGKI